jgi:PTS system nitrogen regulatory IIA component
MDLEIKDVADLLNVSETTIRRWLKDGKIPAYKLNHQYRFSKNEIEDWMVQGGFSPFAEKQIYPPVGGMQQFSLYRAMHKGGVVSDVPGKTKQQVIRQTLTKIASRFGLDPEVVAELLLDREEMMSTALNHGVAVPHPRDSVLKSANSDVVVTVFPEKPIPYGALDHQPVHTLFFLFSSSDKSHLHLLSKLAHFGSQQSALNFLITKPKQDQLLMHVKEWEAKISNP